MLQENGSKTNARNSIFFFQGIVLHELTHSYDETNNARIWGKIGTVTNFCGGMMKFTRTNFNLRVFNYRYVHPIFEHKLRKTIYSQLENVTMPDDSFHEFRLTAGIDYHTLTLLQRHYGFNIKLIHAYQNFSKEPFWKGNMFGKIVNNLGDHVGNPSKLGVYGIESSNSPVSNYYDLNIGYTFYTSLPQRRPTWQAVLFVFRYNVWLPLIIVFFILVLLFKWLLPNSNYNKAFIWIFHAVTGKGTGIRTVAFMNSFYIFILGLWTINAAVISYSYTGSLISALTSPTLERPPQTWQDLIDRDYAIKSMTSAKTGEDVTHLEKLFNMAEGSVYSEVIKRYNTNFGDGNKFRNFHR